MIALLLLACSEYRVQPPEPVPPAEPPGSEQDAFGDPPDWASCSEAFFGQYYNLEWNSEGVSTPGVDTADPEALVFPEIDPSSAGYWEAERLAFQRYDPSLAFGENWWPVDEGWAEDPAFFAARWTAWLRALEGGDVVVALGASTDAWVLLDDTVVASVEGAREYRPENTTLTLRAGVYPLDLRMAHRGGPEAGFRFRVVSGEVLVCYPDFGEG